MAVGLSEARTLELMIKFGYSQAQAQQIANDFKKISGSVQELEVIFRRAGSSREWAQTQAKVVRELAGEYKTLSKIMSNVADVEAAVSRSIQERGKTKDFGVGKGPSGGYGVSFSQFMVGMGLQGIPGMQGVGQAMLAASSFNQTISILQQFTQQAGGVGAAFKGLVTELGPITAVVVGVTAAMAILGDTGRDGAIKVRGFIAATNDFYDQIGKLTRNQAELEVDNRRIALASEQLKLAALEKRYAEERAIAPVATGGGMAEWSDVLEGMGQVAQQIMGSAAPTELGASMGALEVSIRKAKEATVEHQQVIDLWTQKMQDATILPTTTAWMLRGSQAIFERNVAMDKLRRGGSSASIEEMIADRESNMRRLSEKRVTLTSPEVSSTPGIMAEINRIDEQLGQWSQDLIVLRDVLKDRQAAEAYKRGLDALAKSEKEAAERAEDLAKQHGNMVKEINELISARAKQVARQEEEDRIQAERDSVVKDYEARIEAAREQERLTEEGKKLAKLGQDYIDKRLKAWQEYLLDEQRANEDYQLERRRLLEDTYDELSDLASRRDVAGFIQAEREAAKKLKRMDEDAAIESKRRYEDFLRQLAEDQAQFNERMKQEREAGQKRLRESERLERELQARREQWQREDHARRLEQERQDYDERLSLLMIKDGQILAEYDRLMESIRQKTAATAVYSQGLNMNYQFTPRPAPTVQQMTSPYGTTMQPTTNVQVNNTVGDVATKRDLDNVQYRTVQSIRKAVSLEY